MEPLREGGSRPSASAPSRPEMSDSDPIAFEPFDGDLVAARFLRRPNRFVVHASPRAAAVGAEAGGRAS